MDNALIAIITAGVTNLITGNILIAMCLGWLVYLYRRGKNKNV
jgi:branched-subunit amino acid transport protein